MNEREVYRRGARAAQLTLDLGRTAMAFAHVDRVPRYADGERENDAEHSYMLSLVAPEIATQLGLDLDAAMITQYAVVHDLIELKTGDVATFLFDDEAQAEKEKEEHQQLAELLAALPSHTADLLRRYEAQSDSEARFVRYVDKLLPIVVDIVGQGDRIMQEDYGITTIDALREQSARLQARFEAKFAHEFPDLDLAHALLSEAFLQHFDTQVRLGL